jgi:tetratricopeptide (TPR) repeat protein
MQKMDKLTEIIRSLTKQEVRNFKIYEKRIGAERYEKKLVKLFDLLRAGKFSEHDDDLVGKFYDKSNKNAYYRLKNRLTHNLQKSLIEFHLEVDSRMTVLGTIMLARIFYYKANYKVAFNYLQKAEKQAIQAGAFNLLNLIYDEIISLSKYFFEIDPQQYLALKKERQEEYARVQQVDYMLATLNHRLHKTNFGERGADLLKQLEEVQHQFDLLPENQTEAVRIEVHKVVRNILLQKKDFENLQTYLIRSYEQFEKDQFFNRQNHREKIILITWIVNTFHKNKRFEASWKWLEALEEALEAYNKLYYHTYLWTYYQSLITYHSSTGNNDKAISLLESLKEEPGEGEVFYGAFTYLPLISLYFNMDDHSKATENLNELLHTNHYQSLSPPIRMHLAITEVILRIEMEDWNYAHARLKALNRSHRGLLKAEDYAHEKSLVSLLRAIVTKPEPFQDVRLRKKMEAFLESAEREVGSNPIDYVAWLKAHMEHRGYYEVLLELNKEDFETV